jgi:hypothetical protein
MSQKKIPRCAAVDSVNGTRSRCMPLCNRELIPVRSPILDFGSDSGPGFYSVTVMAIVLELT